MDKRIFNRGGLVGAESASGEGQRWLTTFNDMITLLMVFFVLLFSMGSMDSKKFQHFQNALQSAMGVLNAGRRASVGILSNEVMDTGRVMDNMSKSDREINGQIRMADTKGLEAEYTPKGIHLTLDDKLLFDSGSARLTANGEILLERVARIIKPLKRSIRVEGHTDNRSIATPFFPSNWELSTARAIGVVKFLIDQTGIAPHHLSAAGYGDSKPRVPNDTEIRMAKNRRVEIILGPVAESSDVKIEDRRRESE
jgi:chemotaxis protein MotB